MTIASTIKWLNGKHPDQDIEIVNAILGDATLQSGDAGHGSLTSWIEARYGGCGVQGFGGYALYLPESFTHHEVKSHAGHWIYRVMEVAGVENWKHVTGKAVRILKDGVYIRAIAHITEDDVFCPEYDFRKEGE